MTSPLLALPLELRDCIYYHAVDWPDLSVSFQKAQAKCLDAFDALDVAETPACTVTLDKSSEFVTPTILLLNRQITSEALTVLRKKTLTIASPPPCPFESSGPMDITEFIGESALQKVCKVTYRLNFKDHSTKDWVKTLDNLEDIWYQANSLQSIHVQVEGKNPPFRLSCYGDVQEWYKGLLLTRLYHFGTFVPVTWEGDVPKYKYF